MTKVKPTKKAAATWTVKEKWGRAVIESNGSTLRIRCKVAGKLVMRGAGTDLARAQEIARELGTAAAMKAQIDKSATIGLLGSKALESTRSRRWRPSTRVGYETAFRVHVNPALGGIRVTALKRLNVEDLLQNLADEGYSNSLLHTVHQTLRHIATEAVRAGLWNALDNPVSGLRIPKASGKAVELSKVATSDIPTEAQVQELRDALSRRNPMYGVMVDVTAGKGLRWGELLALRPSSFDLAARELTVTSQIQQSKTIWEEVMPKTARGVRKIALDKTLLPVVAKYLTGRDLNATLFTTRNGTPISRSNWRRVLTAAKNEAGWPDHLTWHSLRHYAITRWLHLGLNVADLSTQAGHASISVTTDVYVGRDQGHVQRALAVLDGATGVAPVKEVSPRRKLRVVSRTAPPLQVDP